VWGGESVSKLQDELAINRSVLYRWRDQYRKHGAAGLDWPHGRPPAIPAPAVAPKPDAGEEVALRRHIADLIARSANKECNWIFSKEPSNV